MEEIREWIKFLVIIVGSAIALRTYIVSQRQKRLENSLKLLGIFFNNLEQNDLSAWKRIFMNSSESSGAKKGYFFSKDNQELPFDSLFSEGPDDNGAVNRIVEQIDLICFEALKKTADMRFIYSQIGQLMNTTYSWLDCNNSLLIREYYPNFERIMKRHKTELKKWPTKTYSYCE